MKMNSEINKETLSSIYNGNKDLLMPVLAAFISVMLFLLFIIPQLTAVPGKATEKDSETARLDKLKASTALASSVDLDLLDTQIEDISRALPPAKDFESIINAISSAAANSGAEISSYSLNPGDLASSAEASKYPTLVFSLTIVADAKKTAEFISQLYKTAPISEVSSVDVNGTDAKISILFYYKPIPPVGFENRVGIREMSANEKKAYDEILSWNTVGSLGILQTLPESTGSGSTTIDTSGSPF